jgi:hypothetical protein
MFLYVNGCSHSEDIWQEKDEERNGSFVWSYHLIKNFAKDFKYFRLVGGRPQKRPHILGEKLLDLTATHLVNVENLLINDSISGSGNDRIFHGSLESLTKMIKLGKIPDLVVIQWSGPNRREYCDIDGKPLFVSPSENSHLHPKFEPMASTHTIHYMFILQEFLKKYNIKYYFFTYFGLDLSIKNLHVYKFLDISKFIDFGNNTLYNGLIDLILDRSFNRDEHGHPNQKGAEFISNFIFEKIGNK